MKSLGAIQYKTSKAVKIEKKEPTPLKWAPESVRRILLNRTYIGEYRWNTTKRVKTKAVNKNEDEWFIIPNNHPAIIDEDIFELAQKTLESRRTRRSPSKEYLLRGLASCLDCGGSMSQLTNHYTKANGDVSVYRKLRCTNHVKYGTCYPNLVEMADIDNEVIRGLREIYDDRRDLSGVLLESRGGDELNQRLSTLRKQLNSFQEQFDRQMQAFQAGIITLDQLARYKEQLEESKDKTEEEISQLEHKIQSTGVDLESLKTSIKNCLDVLDDTNASIQKKRQALMTVVKEVQISQKQDLIRMKLIVD